MRGHDRTDAGRDCRPERREPLIQVAADEGELQVRVLRGVAVPGEMFCARGDAPALQAGHEGGDVARDERGLGAEGADPDHRVVRVRVDVRDRREVEVDPDRGQLGAYRGCDLLRQREVVDDSEGPVAGVRAARPGLEPGDVAAFLVGGDKELSALGAERPRQRRDLVRALDVLREEDDAAEAAFQPAAHPVRSNDAVEAGEEAGCGGAIELVRHPLTAPAVRPKAILR